MSTARKYELTEQEYLVRERQAETKSEFYRGEIFAMPGVTRAHSLIVGNCVRALGNRLDDTDCEVHPSDLRVKVSATGLHTYPDVIVVCGESRFDDDFVDTLINPLLLIEVLSDSTEKYDRGAKAAQYRTIPSLRELVFIAQEYPSVECLVRQEHGSWLLREQNDLTQSFLFESLKVSVPLAEIYRRVQFAKPSDERTD